MHRSDTASSNHFCLIFVVYAPTCCLFLRANTSNDDDFAVDGELRRLLFPAVAVVAGAALAQGVDSGRRANAALKGSAPTDRRRQRAVGAFLLHRREKAARKAVRRKRA